MTVCDPCKHAGNLLAKGFPDEAARNHALCQKVQETAGQTWCDCAHQADHSVLRGDRKADPRRGG